MSPKSVWSIVMAGGVGSRFWPLSRAARPKQFLDLFGDGPMLRITVDRVLPIAPVERQVMVTGEIIADEVRAVLPDVPAENILAEPVGRNTAAAVGWAALFVAERDPDGLMMVLPADHHITDVPAYRDVCRRALAAAAEGQIVTLGIPPTSPETGYGYIRRGDEAGEGVFRVDSFKEKPSLERALAYLADGGYYWNSGMFFMPAALAIAELEHYEPELMAGLRRIAKGGPAAVYPGLKSTSIDYAVMERTEHIAVIEGRFGWSDVGSWPSLYGFRGAGEASFHSGEVVELDGGENVLVADGGGLVAAVGVSGLVVVHTPDATLVCPREEAQKVKDVVGALEKSGKGELL